MNEQAQQKRDLFTPGHFGCPGCGATLAMRQTLSVLGEDTIVVMPAGCWSTLIGIYPYHLPDRAGDFSRFWLNRSQSPPGSKPVCPFRETTIQPSWPGQVTAVPLTLACRPFPAQWNETMISFLSVTTMKPT